MDKQLTWRHLRGLHQLYEKGTTRNQIARHDYIRFLLRKSHLRFIPGTERLVKEDSFDALYEQEFLDNYRHYDVFLRENNILKKQSQYLERDIRVLLFVKEQKEKILASQYSRRRFSSAFFKDEDSKYLDEHAALEEAILKLLGLTCFPGNDAQYQQYKFVVDCPNPRFIVLCENLDYLTQPWVSRPYGAELWYAGGNNISKLDHLPELRLPIYYSCDWDYAGLSIYQRILEKIPTLKLLFPEAVTERKKTATGRHRSEWKSADDFSGLNRQCFAQEAVELISQLIRANEWIEEESNDFIRLMQRNRL